MTRIEIRFRRNFLYKWLARKTKKVFLPGFQGVPLYDVISFFKQQVQKVGLNDRARSIAFSFLMAIPAATIFICTLIPYLPVSQKISNQLLLLTKDITPNQTTYQLIHNFINDFINKPRGGLLSIGFLLAIFYSSNAMMGLMRSFNKSLTLQKKRNFFQTRLVAIRLTVLVVFLVIGTVLMLVTQDQFLRWLFRELHIKNHSAKWIFKTLRWVVILPLFYFCIAFIYRLAPAVHKKWRLSSPGTILATALVILTTFVFSYWVNKFGTYNKVYGSIGTIMILMIVVYLNSMILLIGYELNVSIHQLRQTAMKRNFNRG